jgi:MFS family permease
MLNGLSFLAVIISLVIMQVPYAIPPTKNARPLRQMREGLHYVRTDGGVILPLLLLVGVIGFFGLPLIQFYAAFAATALNSPSDGYSAIIIAQGVGSVLAGGAIGMLTYRIGRGRVIGLGVIAIVIINVLLTRQTSIPLAVICAFLSGLSVVSCVISLNTAIQTLVPDQLRGRVLSLYTLAFFGLSPFGALLAGFIASGIGGRPGIGTANAMMLYAVLGGIVGSLVIWRWPEVLHIGHEHSVELFNKDIPPAASPSPIAEPAIVSLGTAINTDIGSQTLGASDR